MAVRQTRNTGLIVTLIFFVFLSIVGIALAIVFYSQLNEAKVGAQTAQTELDRFIESGRRSSQEINQYIAAGQRMDPPRKVVSYLEAEVGRLKRLAAGSEAQETSQIESRLRAAGAAEGQSAVEYAEQLRTERDNALRQAAQLGEEIKQTQSRIAELDTVRQRIEADAKAQRDQLAADIARLAAGVSARDAKLDEELTALTERLDEAQQSVELKRQDLEKEVRDLNRQLEDRQRRITQLQGGLKKETPSVPNPSTEVDGQVIGIPPGKNIVYIDLGRKDHLVLGLTFEVFDANRGVEIEQSEDGRVMRRGKATIEVVNITENSAIGRVVRSSFGQPIQVGDVIANLVYDKQRTFKFYVFSNFDLDGDGVATLTDREMVINLIEQWGGQVVRPDERERQLAALGAEAGRDNVLPFDTDFLVVGQEPPLPDRTPDASDPAELRRAQLAREQLDRYRKLQQEAAALGIPVLNQNRFLALIGYYQR